MSLRFAAKYNKRGACFSSLVFPVLALLFPVASVPVGRATRMFTIYAFDACRLCNDHFLVFVELPTSNHQRADGVAAVSRLLEG